MSLVRSKEWRTSAECERSSVEEALDREYCRCGERPAYAGLCAECYLQDRQDYFDSHYEAVPWSGCWLWTGNVNAGGYGVINVGAASIAAHRFSFAMANKRPITEAMLICHSCDVPGCVNPYHLFEGTHQQNATDSMVKGRKKKAMTPEKVRLIRAMHKSDAWQLKDIARATGVSVTTVSNVLNRKTWDFGIGDAA